MSAHWSIPVWMGPLLFVLAAGAIFWTVKAYSQTRPSPTPALRRYLVFLRSSAFLLLALAVAGPVLSLLATNPVPAELVVIVEDSGSMAIGDAGADAVTARRWEAALTLAGTLDSVFTAHDPPVKVTLLRGNGLGPIEEFRLEDPVIAAPDNHGTNLDRLLRMGRDFTVGRPVGGVVLISDGQDTKGMSGGSTSEPLVDGLFVTGGAPLRVVGVGDPEGPADRVLKDLRYPDTAYQGDSVVVEFVVDHRFDTGETSAPVTARLTGPDGLVAEATLPVDDRAVAFALEFEPVGQGLTVYELEVSGLDNERFLANNRASLALDVRKDRARVLALAAVPGWDVRFLTQAANSEERIDLAVVRSGPSGLVFADSQTVWAAPASADEWLVWDAVVIAGWVGTGAEILGEHLEAAVARGLGLMIIPGDDPVGMPAPRNPGPALARLLPIDPAGWRWSVGPQFPALPAGINRHPILEGLWGPVAVLDDSRILPLPPLEKVVLAELRRGAEVLLDARPESGLREARGVPLLVIRPVGEGRVAWFGGRHLWELGFWNGGSAALLDGASEGMGRRLLRNLLVWTASGTEDSGLAFTGRQALIQEGERIRIAAQWRDMRGLPVTGRKLSLQLRPAGVDSNSQRVQTFAMPPVGRDTGVSEILMPPLPEGPYAIQLIGEGDPAVTSREESLVVAGHSVERTQVRMNRRRLSQLAARADGSFHVAKADDFPSGLIAGLKKLDWAEGRIEQRNRFDFWSGWPFLLLLSLFLGLEWFLRRRSGLL